MKNTNNLALFLVALPIAGCEGGVEDSSPTTDPNATFEEVVYSRGEF